MMSSLAPTPSTVASVAAQRLRDARDELVTRWLDRIAARVALTPNRVFPTDQLLNHMPLLIDGIAAYLESPGRGLVHDGPKLEAVALSRPLPLDCEVFLGAGAALGGFGAGTDFSLGAVDVGDGASGPALLDLATNNIQSGIGFDNPLTGAADPGTGSLTVFSNGKRPEAGPCVSPRPPRVPRGVARHEGAQPSL